MTKLHTATTGFSIALMALLTTLVLVIAFVGYGIVRHQDSKTSHGVKLAPAGAAPSLVAAPPLSKISK